MSFASRTAHGSVGNAWISADEPSLRGTLRGRISNREFRRGARCKRDRRRPQTSTRRKDTRRAAYRSRGCRRELWKHPVSLASTAPGMPRTHLAHTHTASPTPILRCARARSTAQQCSFSTKSHLLAGLMGHLPRDPTLLVHPHPSVFFNSVSLTMYIAHQYEYTVFYHHFTGPQGREFAAALHLYRMEVRAVVIYLPSHLHFYNASVVKWLVTIPLCLHVRSVIP